MKVELAETDHIEQYEAEIERLLDILDFPEALVTDLSLIWDFGDVDLVAVGEQLGFPITGDSYLWEIAKRMKHKTGGATCSHS